jgi:lauroyl/myristoyl acyltransferase
MNLRLAARVARLVPARLVNVVAWPVSVVAVVVAPRTRRQVARHQRRVAPQLHRWRIAIRTVAAFVSYVRYWAETLRMPTISSRRIEAGFRVEGFEHITAGLERGRGVILALPHVGGWEWAGRWLVGRGHDVSVVAEILEPPAVFAEFRRLRESFGFEVIGLDERAGVAVFDALRANRIVCLLSDRDIQGNGTSVEFFNETTTLPAGPAFFALRSGAPLLPVAVYFTDGGEGHLGVVEAPLDVRRNADVRSDIERITQDLAGRFEALISRAPTQWHMFQPNWPSDASGVRRRDAATLDTETQ